MEQISELYMNSLEFAVLCNFPQFCGEERAKEAADILRKMKAEIMTYRASGLTPADLPRAAELVKVQRSGKGKAYILDGFYCVICKKWHKRIEEIEVYYTRSEAEAALTAQEGAAHDGN